ncbi:calponin homology domain-containing protein, partial [Mycena olivaceomarginata]
YELNVILQYVANYKIMQTAFKNKKIDKPIPVEKLVKCKMQDNLEFLQWLKHFWDANYGGGEYDAVARRKGAPADPPATLAPIVAPGPARCVVCSLSHPIPHSPPSCFLSPHRNANATTYAGSTHAAAPRTRRRAQRPSPPIGRARPTTPPCRRSTGGSASSASIWRRRGNFISRRCVAASAHSPLSFFLPLSGGFLPLLGRS